jgi:adenine-specific DNA-methyltransferase
MNRLDRMPVRATKKKKTLPLWPEAEPKRLVRTKRSEMTNGLILQWEGRRVYRQRIPTPRILVPDTGLSHGEGGNMIIEGDSAQVLASLKSRYANEVDVIYIDPPYNRGKDDFRYSDRRNHDPDADDSDAVYVTNEDGGRHTKWLNFMAPKLSMMWELLNEDRGVIFVSINDTELYYLGLLLNEIFDEKNWVGTLVWHGTTDNNPTNIAMEHEYVLCYAKCKEKLAAVWNSPDNEVKAFMLEAYRRMKPEHETLKTLQKAYNAFCKENKDYLGDLYRYKNLDGRGPYAARRNLDNPGKPGHKYPIFHDKNGKACAMPFWGWRFAPDAMDKLLTEKRILFGKDETRIPQLKVHLEDVSFPLRSVISDIDSRAGSNDLERLFGTRDKFKNPKPVELIEKLIGYASRKDSLIVDCFAGSGTTGESVLRLNKRDGGKRRFILVEEGKKDDRYCRTLTAERVKLAIQKDGYKDGFTFYESGRKIDRHAIIGLERDAITALICQADETGKGRGITRMPGHKYIIGKNQRNEAICLVWNGEAKGEVTKEHLKAAAEEVTAAGLKRPFRIYGTFCRVGDTASWKFCQIPDEILAQMHIHEDLEED